MIIIGYLAAILIGVSLGLIGGGGSILTLPAMVYLFGLSPLAATSYSLFVVGSTSLVGAYINFRKGLISIKTGLLFGSISIVTVYTIRKWVLPAIPDNLFQVGDIVITKAAATMVFFALLMLFAAVKMIRGQKKVASIASIDRSNWRSVTAYGVLIGLLTGLLGIGGGFILIPTLVLLVKIPMKKAIGTSLFIIALNAFIGFVGDQGHTFINWPFLLIITLIAIAGMFAGTMVGQRIAGEKLKQGFGWSIALIGSFILLKELLLL
jgi:uncharacterized membrane protein YfcA